jgi:hypothetical protein
MLHGELRRSLFPSQNWTYLTALLSLVPRNPSPSSSTTKRYRCHRNPAVLPLLHHLTAAVLLGHPRRPLSLPGTSPSVHLSSRQRPHAIRATSEPLPAVCMGVTTPVRAHVRQMLLSALVHLGRDKATTSRATRSFRTDVGHMPRAKALGHICIPASKPPFPIIHSLRNIPKNV